MQNSRQAKKAAASIALFLLIECFLLGLCASKAMPGAVWLSRSARDPSCRQDSACLRFGKNNLQFLFRWLRAKIPPHPSGILFAKTLPAIRHHA